MERPAKHPVIRLAFCIVVAALLTAACQTQPRLFYWGGYEDSVQRVAGEENAFDLQAEIDTLETDLEQAQNNDLLVPPGFHAHLGYLLYLRGDLDGAVHQLQAEKERYPESEQFVNGLLARIAPSTVTAP